MTRVLKARPGAGKGAGYRAGQGLRPQAGPVMGARPGASRAGVRPVTAPAPARRAGLAWPRLPASAELATIGAGYAAYSLVRADAGVLAACFGLAGLPVPWRGLLFAYAAGQLAGRLVPLPGGIGGVEGGVLGTLTLTGTPPAAAAAAVIVYRVAGYWAVGVAGTAVAAALARCPTGGPGRDAPQQPAGGRPQAVTFPGHPVHRPGGTVVPHAATEDSTPKPTIE